MQEQEFARKYKQLMQYHPLKRNFQFSQNNSLFNINTGLKKQADAKKRNLIELSSNMAKFNTTNFLQRRQKRPFSKPISC